MSRWQPGQSGNPSGRPPGSGAVAKLRDSIASDVPKILTKLTEAALAGDVQAARLLLERVLPPLKPVEFPADFLLTIDGTLTGQARQVLEALTGGDLAPGQAAVLIKALADVAKIVETDELLKRIEELERLTLRGKAA